MCVVDGLDLENLHEVDTSTFNRNERTMYCNTCQAVRSVVARVKPGVAYGIDDYSCVESGRKDGVICA